MHFLATMAVLAATPHLLADAPQAGLPPIKANEPLLGKWIVRSVQKDGKPTQAQVGRKVGDIIDIKVGVGGIGFG